MQVSRHVRLVHCEDVLDETAHIPFDRRQPQGQVRRRVQGDGRQRGRSSQDAEPGQRAEQALRTGAAAGTAAGPTHATAATTERRRRRWRRPGQKARRWPEQIQLPAETVRSRSEGARHQGPGVPGNVTRIL